MFRLLHTELLTLRLKKTVFHFTHLSMKGLNFLSVDTTKPKRQIKFATYH